MTLHDIENALPPYIRFIHDGEGKAGVIIHDIYMGMIYDTNEGLYYNSQCDQYCPGDVIRKNTFLFYFNHELLFSTRYIKPNNCYHLYRLEPRFRVVYK